MPDTTKIFHSENEQETLRIGQEIGRILRPPRVLLLEGCLGAGKTALTRGIVSGFSGQHLDEVIVHSPTFSLVNQYEVPNGCIYHIDLYRLDTLSDQYSIGLEEILFENSIIVIEWSEKLMIPTANSTTIRLEVESGERRKIIVE